VKIAAGAARGIAYLHEDCNVISSFFTTFPTYFGGFGTLILVSINPSVFFALLQAIQG
jgi:hypothetical protein